MKERGWVWADVLCCQSAVTGSGSRAASVGFAAVTGFAAQTGFAAGSSAGTGATFVAGTTSDDAFAGIAEADFTAVAGGLRRGDGDGSH